MKYVTPGRRLCLAENVTAGPGTYIRGEYIYSSVVGVVRELTPSAEGEPRIITVSREKFQSTIPEVGSVVTGKVIRMTTKEAVVSIIVVGSVPCNGDFQGIIRSQDVRKDKVKIIDSYRLGDIVRAKVVSYCFYVLFCIPILSISS